MPIPNHNIGGFSMRVPDCYIWSEIYYLDSPTDYRECLPQHIIHPSDVSHTELSILDSSENNLTHCLLKLLAFLAACLIVCSVVWDRLR
jgi:hypothetical protein